MLRVTSNARSAWRVVCVFVGVWCKSFLPQSSLVIYVSACDKKKDFSHDAAYFNFKVKYMYTLKEHSTFF